MRRVGQVFSLLTLLALTAAPGVSAQGTTGAQTGPVAVTTQNNQAASAVTIGPQGVTQTLPGGGPAGNFAYFRVWHSGTTPIRLTYAPADPIATAGFGIRIYSPTGALVDTVMGATDRGGVGIADYDLTTAETGWYTIQVFNYTPQAAISFTIQGVAAAPPQPVTAAAGSTTN